MTRSAASASATPSKKPLPSLGGSAPALPKMMSPTAENVTVGGGAGVVGGGVGVAPAPGATVQRAGSPSSRSNSPATAVPVRNRLRITARIAVTEAMGRRRTCSPRKATTARASGRIVRAAYRPRARAPPQPPRGHPFGGVRGTRVGVTGGVDRWRQRPFRANRLTRGRQRDAEQRGRPGSTADEEVRDGRGAGPQWHLPGRRPGGGRGPGQGDGDGRGPPRRGHLQRG